MKETMGNVMPKRVTDLIGARRRGAEVSCETSFEIVPVDFEHRHNPFRAFVFLCRYSGNLDSRPYTFRKCYARGCPHNLCPHVSQAVLIANRYLQRDHRRLREADIDVEDKLFALNEMVVQFDTAKEERDAVLTIDDYVGIAKAGNPVEMVIDLEYVPAVEHFVHYENSQTFLTVNFVISCRGGTCHFERCLACYPTEEELQEKPHMIEVANERLKLMYKNFDGAGIKYKERFFV
ncbi:MAG: hypothetical protein WAL90_16575 [Desulfobacterales bacterium]